MDHQPNSHTPRNMYEHLTRERDLHATMCAMYTEAGLYDLAKERARLWKSYTDKIAEYFNQMSEYYERAFPN